MPSSVECDGQVTQCTDGSDELPLNRNCAKRTCDVDEFTCRNGNCIPSLWSVLCVRVYRVCVRMLKMSLFDVFY